MDPTPVEEDGVNPFPILFGELLEIKAMLRAWMTVTLTPAQIEAINAEAKRQLIELNDRFQREVANAAGRSDA